MEINSPYILSVPSWVIPGTYAENLRFLETKNAIQGVELLFFLYNDELKTLFDSEWDEICSYAKRFIFTAHLPELLLPAHSDLIARLAPIVRHLIIHPQSENISAQVALLSEWTKLYNVKFLAENTNPGLLETMLPYLDLNSKEGICMDTGHLLLNGKKPASFMSEYCMSLGEVHLHSVDPEQAAIDGRLKDHRRLRSGEPWLLELLPLFKDYNGVINLEVFSWEEAEASIKVLSKLFHLLREKG